MQLLTSATEINFLLIGSVIIAPNANLSIKLKVQQYQCSIQIKSFEFWFMCIIILIAGYFCYTNLKTVMITRLVLLYKSLIADF